MTRSVLEGDIVWLPERDSFDASALGAFVRRVQDRDHPEVSDYPSLLGWSVAHPEEFWSLVADDAAITWHDTPTAVLTNPSMPGDTWFPGGTLNYVDLALRRRDDSAAVIFQREDGAQDELSWSELADQVRRAAAGLRRLGVECGDRVAAYVPNRVESVIAFLAVASLGAVWTATSPDFGEQSVLDRFTQVGPRVLVVVSGYSYNGRWHDRRDVVTKLVEGLPTVEHVVALPGGEDIPDSSEWSSLLAQSDEPLVPTAVPFDHPLWIVYTSGTTGRPKSIVHGHGGVVLEHHKLLRLQLGLSTEDRFFWYSTTGWIMWNILIGGLLVGTPIVLYDGSPTYPNEERLWDLAEQTSASFLGLSAGFIQTAMTQGHHPRHGRDLSALSAVGVTGSPLAADGYAWLLEGLGSSTFIASISGGTDVATGFLGCSRSLPVRAGHLQTSCLGIDAVAVDDAGNVVVGTTGELVIRAPMPSMPVGFWGDTNGERYRSSYFDVFPGWWRHGDWIRFDEDGSCVILGRSDATLNRGGIRMGTSDFYSVLDGMAAVRDCLVLDVASSTDAIGSLILIVQLAGGGPGNDDIEREIRSTLRSALSPRHNPDQIIVVERLARTMNGKRIEVPAKRLFQGEALGDVIDASAVNDPAALELLNDAAMRWRAANAPTPAIDQFP